MKKSLLISILILMISTITFAGGNEIKSTQVKGTITDKQGNALVGAKIVVEDMRKEVYTDFDGNFTLGEISANEHQIVVSHISYREMEVKIDFSKNFNNQLSFQLLSR